MDIDPAHRHHCEVGRKSLHVDAIGPRPVEGVADIGPKSTHIDVFNATANFLVAGEKNSNRTMWDFGVFHQMGRGFHDNRDACLVVGAQQCRAVGRDERTVMQLLEFRIVGDANHLAGIAGQWNITPAVVSNHLGPHVGSAGCRRGIQMGVECDDRHWPCEAWRGRSQRPIHVHPDARPLDLSLRVHS